MGRSFLRTWKLLVLDLCSLIGCLKSCWSQSLWRVQCCSETQWRYYGGASLAEMKGPAIMFVLWPVIVTESLHFPYVHALLCFDSVFQVTWNCHQGTATLCAHSHSSLANKVRHQPLFNCKFWCWYENITPKRLSQRGNSRRRWQRESILLHRLFVYMFSRKLRRATLFFLSLSEEELFTLPKRPHWTVMLCF